MESQRGNRAIESLDCPSAEEDPEAKMAGIESTGTRCLTYLQLRKELTKLPEIDDMNTFTIQWEELLRK